MVICLLALVTFSVLGIFSAKYRTLAKDAFDCVLRRIRLQPCTSGLDRKLKMRVFNKLDRFPKLARIWYRHFEAISWTFVILLLVSLFFTTRGIYSLVKYGTCDPHSNECVFSKGITGCASEHCLEGGCQCEAVGCETPEYEACEGNCTCIEEVCG